jgi:ParB family chromosome partitioning protein
MINRKLIDAPINDIQIGEHALREVVQDESFDELCNSIRRNGIIEPLICEIRCEIMLLVAGHRRLTAAKRVGLDTVPVIIESNPALNLTEVAFAENMLRKDMTPVEISVALLKQVEECGKSVAELAHMLHKSESWIRYHLAMSGWPEEILQAVHSGGLSPSAASSLVLITDNEYRNYLLRNAVENGVTANVTAAWLQAWRSALPMEKAVEAEPIPGSAPQRPIMPMSVCIKCGQTHPPDAMAMVLACTSCIREMRNQSPY